MATATEKLAKEYFRSWPNRDFGLMRDCLAERITFDSGAQSYEGDADRFVAEAAAGPAWTHVTLLSSVFQEDRAALLYEATETGSGTRMRVGEFLTVEEGKITAIEAAIAEVQYVA